MNRMLIATVLVGMGMTAQTTQAAQAEQTLVSQGEYLARAGDCVACHTAKDGKPFAGGLPMETPIGTIYSTNTRRAGHGFNVQNDRRLACRIPEIVKLLNDI